MAINVHRVLWRQLSSQAFFFTLPHTHTVGLCCFFMCLSQMCLFLYLRIQFCWHFYSFFVCYFLGYEQKMRIQFTWLSFSALKVLYKYDCLCDRRKEQAFSPKTDNIYTYSKDLRPVMKRTLSLCETCANRLIILRHD